MLVLCVVASTSAVAQVKGDDAAVHNKCGVDLYKKGDLDGAIGEYRQALRLKPDDPQAQSSLAELLAEKATRESKQ